ncbi:uncharacterized protein [Dermacentor albipictus]|uniref:uncharacterized protein isoform X4 n=1 Tax=Dermacentor albipictus TaxID=60249 RepID=UPI0038FC8ED3
MCLCDTPMTVMILGIACLSNRALMEKVVCGIKIKVAGFVISMILSIYLISTIDVDALVEAYEKELAKNDKKPRMGNDSWSLDPGLILRDSINLIPGPKYLPGPMYLALAPKKSDEKDKDEPSDKKSSAETAKAALIYGSLMYLIFWTGFDTANIRRQFASAVTSTSRAQEGHAVSAAPFPTSTKGHKLALYIQKNQDHVVSLIRFAGC